MGRGRPLAKIRAGRRRGRPKPSARTHRPVTISGAARRHDEELASLEGGWSTHVRLTASVAVIFLMWSGPAAHTRQVQAAHVPQPVRERLSVLVPAPPPAGATALGQPAFYNSSTVYEYMDGGADAFQGSDVQALFHRRFRTGQVEVVVDIFDMGTLENAFGTYSAERSPKREYLTMGAEGDRGKGSLNFVQARYYVKLLGNGEGADVAVQQFASAISGRIGSDKALPAVLALLPDTRRKPGVDPAEPARRFRCGLQGRGGIAPVEARTGERMGEKHSRRDFLVKPVRWVAAAGLLGRALPSLLAQPRTPQGARRSSRAPWVRPASRSPSSAWAS